SWKWASSSSSTISTPDRIEASRADAVAPSTAASGAADRLMTRLWHPGHRHASYRWTTTSATVVRSAEAPGAAGGPRWAGAEASKVVGGPAAGLPPGGAERGRTGGQRVGGHQG